MCNVYNFIYISKAQKGMSELLFPQVIVINKTTSSDIKAWFAKNISLDNSY